MQAENWQATAACRGATGSVDERGALSSAASSRIHAGLSSKWVLKGLISQANQWSPRRPSDDSHQPATAAPVPP
ncbi:hypothetical protein CBM2587_B90155 [Cupriavidus taiwanensis]|uniref:Uncharacterized protein n=1 Tax=Cupriavidus taiwanensis TaxID=164546 RepID=A0A975XE17_9BURK|nr:hypothetical protein CBM2587_B90155 [Cupriavidus taiwanensis]